MIWFKIPYAQIVEWLCFIAAIVLLLRCKPKFWQSFIPFLGITVTVETYGYYSSMYMHGTNNHWLYNSFLAIYVLFHLYVFFKIINQQSIKILCALFMVILFAVYIWEWQQHGFNQFFFKTNALFGVIITCLSIIFFGNLFVRDEDINLSKSAPFWFVTGCLIFYATSTCVNALFLATLKGSYLRYIVIVALNFIMYSCWIKSFLCIRKAQNLT